MLFLIRTIVWELLHPTRSIRRLAALLETLPGAVDFLAIRAVLTPAPHELKGPESSAAVYLGFLKRCIGLATLRFRFIRTPFKMPDPTIPAQKALELWNVEQVLACCLSLTRIYIQLDRMRPYNRRQNKELTTFALDLKALLEDMITQYRQRCISQG